MMSITRNQSVKILRISLLQNIVMGRLAKLVFIFKPARPASVTWNSLPRWSKFIGLIIMTGFVGFPSGKNPYVPVPEVFFTVLLPEIEDSAELKVTLHLFWLLAQKKGNPRCVSGNDLRADHVLLRSLKRRGDPRPPEERLRQGLEQALARGTLLRIHLRLVSEGDDQAEVIEWYFFNTTRSRKVVDELQGGAMVPVRLLHAEHDQVEEESGVTLPAGAYTNRGVEATRNIQVQIERPNIFVLYE